jgi:hypothetical protein
MRWIILILLNISSIVSHTQSDSLNNGKFPFPEFSYENDLERIFPNLKYSYNRSQRIHDYSGNWDFDGDYETDSIYFIGNDAVNTYYYVSIVLSSDGQVRNFQYLLLDFPSLGRIDELEDASFYPPPRYPQFVVYDFDSDMIDEIFLIFDTRYSLPENWKTHGIYSRYVLIDYKCGDLEVSDFVLH